MTLSPLPPLAYLATALAYMIGVDRDNAIEERAKFLSIFHKHVRRGELTDDSLKALTEDAFVRAKAQRLGDFLHEANLSLTHAQKMAILLNLFDLMVTDGRMTSGEIELFDEATKAFGTNKESFRAVREMLILKNDTTVFTNALHPCNESSYQFGRKFDK